MLRKIKEFTTRRIGSFLFIFLYPLNQILKKTSAHHWELMTRAKSENRGLPMHRQAGVVYKANNAITSESHSQQGSPVDYVSQNRSPVLVPNWAKEIGPFLANQLSRHTRRAYENDLRQFFLFLTGRIEGGDIGQLRADHIILFRKYLEEGRLNGKVMGQATINRKLASIKSFLQWLKQNQLIKENPASLVKGFPQSQESSLNGLSDEEVCKILDLPKRNTRAGALHGAILHFLLYTGVRKSELLDLKMGDLTEERGVKVVKVRGKGHKVRILPLTARVIAYLEHYFHVCGRDSKLTEAPLFIPTKNNRTFTLEKRLNPHAITYIVSHYAKKAGVLKPVSPHSCRATCISNALDRKATHRSVQHLAGWSTPLMIQRYDKRREDLKNSAAFLIDYGEEVAPTAPN
jgi:integrase/recombinase XerC